MKGTDLKNVKIFHLQLSTNLEWSFFRIADGDVDVLIRMKDRPLTIPTGQETRIQFTSVSAVLLRLAEGQRKYTLHIFLDEERTISHANLVFRSEADILICQESENGIVLNFMPL